MCDFDCCLGASSIGFLLLFFSVLSLVICIYRPQKITRKWDGPVLLGIVYCAFVFPAFYCLLFYK